MSYLSQLATKAKPTEVNITNTQQVPQQSDNISYREIFEIINSSAFAVLISGVLVSIVIGRAGKKLVARLLTIPWVGKIPATVTAVHDDFPDMTESAREIEKKLSELLITVDRLDHKSAATDTQIVAIREQVHEIVVMLHQNNVNHKG